MVRPDVIFTVWMSNSLPMKSLRSLTCVVKKKPSSMTADNLRFTRQRHRIITLFRGKINSACHLPSRVWSCLDQRRKSGLQPELLSTFQASMERNLSKRCKWETRNTWLFRSPRVAVGRTFNVSVPSRDCILMT